MPKILIIDDDPNILKLLRSKLETRGASVTAASNTDEAVAAARTDKPDLIVCDIDLGEGGDGGSLAGILEEITGGTPLIFLSSMVTKQDMAHGAGGRRMISKSIAAGAIVELIYKSLPQSPG